jgi:hypothetical protein
VGDCGGFGRRCRGPFGTGGLVTVGCRLENHDAWSDPRLEESGPCWQGYLADAVEDAASVTITIHSYGRSKPSLPSGVFCPAIAYERSLRVSLRQPLGDRVVFDGGGDIPVPLPVTTIPAPQGGGPPVRRFGTDCGIFDEMSGWPTTTLDRVRIDFGAVPPPGLVECIVTAAEVGTPARLSLVRASEGDSGRRTTDGYPLPAATVVSYVVQEDRTIDVIADTRGQPGGGVSTRTCTAISSP